MNLLIRFNDKSPSFTNGVEFGRLLQKIEQGDEYIINNGFPVHIENTQVLKDTCKCYGYTCVFGNQWEGWVDFIAIKKTMSEN